MQEIKNQVEFILRSYTTMKKEVQVLEYELERITLSLSAAVIEDRVLSRPEYERVSGSHISDKTSDIVVEYVDSQRNSRYHAITTLLHNMRFELNRLEYYLSMLPEDEAAVIKMFYFDALSWGNIVKVSSCSLSTMQRRKKRGLDKLADYYSILDKLAPEKLDILTRARFVSYIHEERFIGCLESVGKHRTPGIEAMLYILTGCNELWQAGVDTFFDFKTGETISCTESKSSLSDNGRKLLRLAYHFANGMDQADLINVLQYYFPGLEYVYLELAIEAVKLALFPGAV